MRNIPSYDEWQSNTYRLLDRRGPLLKDLDKAIELQDRSLIETAFNAWKKDKAQRGKKWWHSVFNEQGAITRLYRALNNDRILLTHDEIAALRWLKQQQEVALRTQFQANQVTWKNSTLMGLKQNTGSLSEKLQGNKIATAKNTVEIASLANSIKGYITVLCKGTASKVNPEHVLAALGLGSLSGFVSSIIPLIGTISSGGKALIGWTNVARQTWEQVALLENSGRTIAHGDPDAAFRAMLAIVERRIQVEKNSAAIATTAFTGKALGLFADAGAVSGAAVGLTETLANLFQTIFEYVRIEEERIKANELIARGQLDFHLFESCPILGCYYLLVQDHSTVIALSMSSYGQEGWMMEAELLRTELDQVLAKARTLVESSPIEICRFRNYKGFVAAKSLADKMGSTVSDAASDAWSATKNRIWSYIYSFSKDASKDEIELSSFSTKRDLYSQKLQVMKAVSTYNRETGFFSRQSKESLSAVQHLTTLFAHGQTDENIQEIDNFLRYLLKGGPKPAGYDAGTLNPESRLAKLLTQAMV
jgi:hypothetical protein